MSKAFGNIFGSSKPETTTPYQSLPQFAQTGFEQLFERLIGKDGAGGLFNNAQAFTPTPLNTRQTQALNQLASLPTNLGYQAQGFMKGAQNAFGQAQNMYGQIPSMVNEARGYTSSGVNPITGEEIKTNIDYFMNPYIQDVVNSGLQDLRDEAAYGQSAINAKAASSGAFGGTRQALLESENQRNLLRELGNLSGNLRMQGFSQASNQALNKLQQERANFLQGAGLSYQGANTLGSAASGLSNLGQAYLQGNQANRQNAEREAQLRYDLAKGGAEALGGAGDVEYDLAEQTRQIPMQQMQLLAQMLGLVPHSASSAQSQDVGWGGALARTAAPILGGLGKLGI